MKLWATENQVFAVIRKFSKLSLSRKSVHRLKDQFETWFVYKFSFELKKKSQPDIWGNILNNTKAD